MKYEYCLFDLDGTLTDPAIGITNSVMYALKKFDLEVSDRTELYPFIGPPLDYSFMTFFGFTKEQAELAIKYYRENFSVTGLFENEVYEGVPAMLDDLKNKGVKIALATSKPYEFSIKILKHFDLYKYFDFFGAATMLMVGDRYHDIDGAKANDLDSAGVLWGYGSKEELENAGAKYILNDPSDLADLF